ncbi:hypothetical protein AYO44_12500 [Planctomycetaceae bacterium SCGC AG-212-F19]|nr:hypothetical protein AYO44_12500 [Planctomycetaceae bacterium SCGC AG-212-F19]
MTDDQLLEAYVKRRDAAAFEELVRRHGPMVLRVCQRVLGHVQDAEDAFQAAFIVLARKASVISAGAVSSWLYGVAYRVSLQLKEWRRKHASEQPLHEVERARRLTGQHEPEVDADTRRVLFDELSRLPEKYRTPVVLCYLEGKTNGEAAQQIGCTEGAVRGMLTRARERLQSRLTRRGVALAGVALPVLLAPQAATAALAPTLAASTAQAATLAAAGKVASGAVLSSQASALAGAVLKGLFWSKVKAIGLGMVAVTALVAVPAVLLLSPPDPGLVGHYRFAETSGTRVVDDSPARNMGTLVGGATRTAGPKPGTTALLFDGKTGYVQLDKELTPWLGGTATVAYWFKTTQASLNDSGNPGVAGVQRSSNDDVGWGVIDSGGRLWVDAGGKAPGVPLKARSNRPVNDGTWHHVAMTRDAVTGRVEMFVDGALNGTVISGKGQVTTPFATIGKLDSESAGKPIFIQGAVADLRFYKRVLSAEEIKVLAR